MTLQSSGAISLTDIRDEYNNGSSAPIELDDYYRGGSFVRANATNNTSTNLSADVPTSANSSPLSINDFYGQKRAFRKTYASTATDQSGVGVFGDDFAVDYPKEIVINSSKDDEGACPIVSVPTHTTASNEWLSKPRCSPKTF